MASRCTECDRPVCFCHLKGKKVLDLARARYARHVPTVDLMREQVSPESKRIVAGVALLDVPVERLALVLGTGADRSHLRTSRDALVARLRRHGVRGLPEAA